MVKQFEGLRFEMQGLNKILIFFNYQRNQKEDILIFNIKPAIYK